MTKILLILFSILFSQFSIKDNKVYNTISNKYYSDEEFINLLIHDINFSNDDNFKKYKKSHINLQFRKSWWTYLVLAGSWGAGIEGIRYPERWEEGGEHYDPDGSNTAPGLHNIVLGTILYSSYHKYNKIRKDRSLAYVINKYNNLYSKYSIEPIKIPDPFFDKSAGWGFSGSIGVSTDKASIGIGNVSISKYLNQKSEVYGALGGLIFTLNFGAGYTHYFDSRYISSNFVGTSISLMLAGDGGGGSGYSNRSTKVYFGRSFQVISLFEILKVALNLTVPYLSLRNVGPSSFLNLGLVVDYSDNPSKHISNDYNHWTLMPLLTFESRISF